MPFNESNEQASKKKYRMPNAYVSRQNYIKSLTRRRDGIREMIKDTKIQISVLENAESTLSAQIAEVIKSNEERKMKDDVK